VKAPHKNRSGFTLVEILVATTLLAVVMTAVYTLFFGVIQSWRNIENDHGHHRKARNVLALIQREYDNVFAPAAHLTEGTSTEITFFVLAPPMLAEDSTGPHLMRVRYRFERNTGQLEREEALVEAALPATIENPDEFDRGRIQIKRSERVVVARGLEDFNISYVWMPRPNGAYWRETPVDVEPLLATHHRIPWGLPQALDVYLSYRADDDETPYDVELRMPTRTGTIRREAYQLRNILGDAL
jgi:prepilin-type N-terminal cleavage/methylation domain-containing protein